MQNCSSINWPFLCAHWKRVLAGMLLGLAIAGAAFMLMPPQWQASALIQLGRSGGAGMSSTMQGDSSDIVVAKIMRPTFIKAAMQRAGRPDMVKPLLPLIYRGKGRLNARGMNSGVVTVTLRAPSSDLAKQLMEGVVAEVLEEQNQSIETHMRYAREAYAGFWNSSEQSKSQDASWISRQMASTFLGNTLTALNDLRVRMIGDVEVQSRPVFPDPYCFAALGLVLGVVLTAGLLYQAKPKL